MRWGHLKGCFEKKKKEKWYLLPSFRHCHADWINILTPKTYLLNVAAQAKDATWHMASLLTTSPSVQI